MPNPTPDRPYMPDYGLAASDEGLLPWSWAEARLTTARNFWLATVRPDGRPHLMPIWAVYLEGVIYFSCGGESRKAKNLRTDPRCVIAAEVTGKPAGVSVEGTAAVVRDSTLIARIAAIYTEKYDFRVYATATGIAIEPDDNEGDPLWVIQPTVAFGNDEDFTQTTTRWRFA